MGCALRVGVAGTPIPKPRLKRALGGTGMPGRRVWPGRGDSSVPPREVRPVSSVKWSVCGGTIESGIV